jgi:protein-glucosylgalactosylhydroxylysine glucosidase
VRIPDEGTPAMTYSIFTTLYSRLLDADNAYKYFKESHQDYLRQPFNVFTEGKWGDNPYFLTGAGGVIQSMVFGFGGYDITEDGIKRIKTVIPKEWKSVTIKGFLEQGYLKSQGKINQ